MANKYISQFTEDTSPAANDLVLTQDVSDTTDNAEGTYKKVTKNNLLTGTADIVLPSQTSASGKVLQSNGTTASWQTPSAGSGDVTGPASSTLNHIPQFSDTTGKVLKDGLAVVTTLGSPGTDTNLPSEAAVRAAISAAGGGDVSGPASSTNLNIAVFSGTSGKLLADGGAAISGLATSGHNHDSAYVAKNGAITGATKTKITYDAKGLVTGGADATTADIADSTNKRYVTDAQLTVIGNTSGTNTGDQTLPTDATIAITDVTTNNVSTSAHGWTPKAPNDTTKFLCGDGTWAVPSGGTGVTDGDKGDITVSSSGTVWTVDNSAITEAKLSMSDVTTANATTSAHGLLPKLGGGTSNFLRADGSWAAPSGSSAAVPRIYFNFNPITYKDDLSASNGPIGYSASGTGASATNSGHMRILDWGTTSSGSTQIYCYPTNFNTDSDALYVWDNDPQLQAVMSYVNGGTGSTGTLFFCLGSTYLPTNLSTRKQMGIKCSIDNGVETWYATNSNGTAETTTDITSAVTWTSGASSYFRVSIEMVSGSSIKYYIKGTLVATHTTNIPSGYSTIYPIGMSTTAGTGNTKSSVLRQVTWQISYNAR